jgi:hypothetical protein
MFEVVIRASARESKPDIVESLKRSRLASRPERQIITGECSTSSRHSVGVSAVAIAAGARPRVGGAISVRALTVGDESLTSLTHAVASALGVLSRNSGCKSSH